MSLAFRRRADTHGVELALQAFQHDVGVHVVAGSPRFVAGAQTARDELCMDAAALDARTNRRFDKLGQGLAIRQHGLKPVSSLRKVLAVWRLASPASTTCANRQYGRTNTSSASSRE